MAAFASGEYDCVFTDVRPCQPHQVTQSQARVTSEIDGVSDLGRAGAFNLGDVGVCPDDFRAVVVVQVFDSLAGIGSYCRVIAALQLLRYRKPEIPASRADRAAGGRNAMRTNKCDPWR